MGRPKSGGKSQESAVSSQQSAVGSRRSRVGSQAEAAKPFVEFIGFVGLGAISDQQSAKTGG